MGVLEGWAREELGVLRGDDGEGMEFAVLTASGGG